MKKTATIIGTIACLTPVAAFADSGNVDDGGFFVWVFLGFCALIIASQIIPAILLMCGLVKGVSQAVTEKKAAPEKKS